MIIIDRREPLEIRNRADAVRELPCDASVIGEHGVIRIERKSVTDFMSSLESGRLNAQLLVADELVIFDDDKWLPRNVFDTLHTDGKLRKAVNGVSEHHPVKFAVSVDDYVGLLRNIETKLNEGRYACMRPRRVVVPGIRKEVAFVASIPGLAETLAERIISKYKTPMEALINMNRWNLEIEGVGVNKVEAAMKFMLGLKSADEEERGDEDGEMPTTQM